VIDNLNPFNQDSAAANTVDKVASDVVNNLNPFNSAPPPAATSTGTTAASSTSTAAAAATSAPASNSQKNGKPTPLDAGATVAALLRPALFAQAAYCSSDVVTKWKCGPPCDALGKDVEVLLAGGDNDQIPRYYIAHDKSENRIVVAHQGTDAKSVYVNYLFPSPRPAHPPDRPFHLQR
jgi:hypothetical protein